MKEENTFSEGGGMRWKLLKRSFTNILQKFFLSRLDLATLDPVLEVYNAINVTELLSGKNSIRNVMLVLPGFKNHPI